MDTNFDGIVDKIQEILNKVRAPINKGIDKVLEMIIGLAQGVIKMGKDAVDSVMEWWKKEKKFTNQDGHRHRLFFRGEGKHARLVMKDH